MQIDRRHVKFTDSYGSALTVISLALSLSGCIPSFSTYYAPRSELGRVEREGPCSMDIRRTILLPLAADAEVDVRAFRYPNNSAPILVSVAYWIGPGHIAQLVDTAVTVREKDNLIPFVYEIKELGKGIAPTPATRQTAQELMRGEGPSVADIYARRTPYTFSFNLLFENPEEFTLVLPATMIDGRRIEATAVTFTRKRSMHVTAICF